MFDFREEHGNNLPTIRIQKIVMDNFKSVNHGEVTFHCGKHFVPYDTKSDILGVYGQNGSGKTSLVEALAILRYVMRGAVIPDPYIECISKRGDHSRLSFVFDLQYPDGKIRKVMYSFSIAAIEKSIEEQANEIESYAHRKQYKQRVVVYDEVISMSGDFEDTQKPMKPIIDTSSTDDVFEPKAKQRVFVNTSEAIEELKFIKRLTWDKACSFIFYKDTMQIFYDSELYSEYFQVLMELRYYADYYLYVVDTRSFGFIRSGLAIPIYTRQGTLPIDIREPTVIPTEIADDIVNEIDSLNTVLEQLIPLLSIELRTLYDTVTKDGESGRLVELIAKRDDIEMPIRYESDGVKKIISILSLVIAVFNDRSITVAIDEIDAGIYEYLLGELLKMIQDSGKGQLIFTSHNLRPLEVLNKEFICFTTTNPDNRYYRMKGVGATNNLRNTYIREIMMNDQDEELYKKTKSYKTLDALTKAGIALAGAAAVVGAVAAGASAIVPGVAGGVAAKVAADAVKKSKG